MRRMHAALAAIAGLTLGGAAQAQSWEEQGDAGQLPVTAQFVAGSGPVTAINGNLGLDDVDMYVLDITSPTTFSASTVNTTVVDTQLYLFRLDGTGIVMDDDDPSGTTLQSTLSSTFTASLAPGTYLLAVSGYDMDPMAAGLEIWADTPFAVERAPDGLNPSGAVDSWGDLGFDEGPYSITLTGTSFTAPPVVGACTLPSGACATTTAAFCAAAGGAYQGNGTSCPTGACCTLDGNCSILTAAECADANGTYGGDNSSCGGNCPNLFAYSGGAVPIPDGVTAPTCGGGPGGDAVAEIVVNQSFTISSVSVSYFIEHSWQGDLMIALKHVPSNTTVVVVDRPGATGQTCGFGNDNLGSFTPTYFRSIDSAAATYDIGSPGAPTNDADGPWKPENPLSMFVGHNSAGPWQLIVSDWSEFDTGSIHSFILELGGPTCYPDCNGDNALNLGDFGCFQTKFALGCP